MTWTVYLALSMPETLVAVLLAFWIGYRLILKRRGVTLPRRDLAVCLMIVWLLTAGIHYADLRAGLIRETPTYLLLVWPIAAILCGLLRLLHGKQFKARSAQAGQ